MAYPVSLADILDGGTAGLHPSAAYIFRKQIEEAEAVLGWLNATILRRGEKVDWNVFCRQIPERSEPTL
jgi:hypothetical protein